jgi:hypothetical protein
MQRCFDVLSRARAVRIHQRVGAANGDAARREPVLRRPNQAGWDTVRPQYRLVRMLTTSPAVRAFVRPSVPCQQAIQWRQAQREQYRAQW